MPSSTGVSHEEAAEHQVQSNNASLSNERQPQSTNDAAERHTDTETLPDYTQHPAGLPSYARVARDDRIRRESLQAFVDSKMYTQDNFGGLKGIATGPPNDPAKPFKWIKRKFQGENNVWRKLSDEEKRKWEAEGGDVDYDAGEVAVGDMNTSMIA